MDFVIKRFTACRRFVCVPVMLLMASLSLADDDTKELVKKAHELAEAESRSFTIRRGGVQLKLDRKSVLHWSNPVSGQIYGDVYIWTNDGRPEVIASIYKWFSPHTHLATEFQSLSEAPLTATQQNGSVVWKPKAGLQMMPLPDAGKPASRERLRTVQMRKIAAEFAAEATDRSDPATKWSLRLQRNPIYRYTSPARKIIDGALFAYCQGNTNNPEVLLMLEAHEQGKDVKWHYALVRQNSIQFRVHRHDTLIWDVPKLAPPWDAVTKVDQPYLVLKKVFPE